MKCRDIRQSDRPRVECMWLIEAVLCSLKMSDTICGSFIECFIIPFKCARYTEWLAVPVRNSVYDEELFTDNRFQALNSTRKSWASMPQTCMDCAECGTAASGLFIIGSSQGHPINLMILICLRIVFIRWFCAAMATTQLKSPENP